MAAMLPYVETNSSDVVPTRWHDENGNGYQKAWISHLRSG
jgi:hypothetical protein